MYENLNERFYIAKPREIQDTERKNSLDKIILAKIREFVITADVKIDGGILNKLLYDAYVMGQNDTMDTMRDMYEEDPCSFEEYFEEKLDNNM